MFKNVLKRVKPLFLISLLVLAVLGILTVGPVTGSSTISLYVDGYTLVLEEWTPVGTPPYLSTQNQPTDYGYASSAGLEWEEFTFTDLTGTPTINSVNLSVYAYADEKIQYSIWDSGASAWTAYADLVKTSGWGWYTVDISTVLTTDTEVDNAKVKFKSRNVAQWGGGNHVDVDCARLDVDYTEVVPDTTPPTWSNDGTNNTGAGQPTLFHVEWTDDVGLSGFIFGTNNTGSWANDTWASMSGTTDWSNVTKILNSTPGVTVQWCVWANDTSNNWNDTGTLSLVTTTADVTPPTWSNAGTNNTFPGQPTLFHVKWTDNVELSGFIFGTNNTGTWANDTWTSMSGTTDWSNVTKTLNSTADVTVQWRVWANDTSNNWNDTGTLSLVTVVNLPPVANFTESAHTVTAGEVIHFDPSSSYDPDGNITKYFWDFGDGTNTTVFPGVDYSVNATSPYITVVPTSTVNTSVTPGSNYTVAIYTDYVGELVNDNWTGDGTQTTFNTTLAPVVEDSEKVSVNGTTMTRDTNYTINYETGNITFTTAPGNGAEINATYTHGDIWGWQFTLYYDPNVLHGGINTTDTWTAPRTNTWIVDRVGKTRFYTDLRPVVENSEEVYVNGTLMTKPTEYTMDYTKGKITFATAPGVGANVTAIYVYLTNVFYTTLRPVVEDSEKVYVNQTLMTKPANYTIDYTNGIITFTKALGLGTEIKAIYLGNGVTNGDLITQDKYIYATFTAGRFNNNAGNLSLTTGWFKIITYPAFVTAGPGTLAYVTFTVVGTGRSNITLGDRTQLIGFTKGGAEPPEGETYYIIKADEMPDHIQHGYFANGIDHAYNEAGNYTVTLTVTDDDGATASVSANKTVLPNQPPVASFTYSPLTPYINETVTFNATTSYDPDGSIVSYAWDFGDNTTGTSNITTHSYADDGNYTVTLNVTDNFGLSNTTSANVTVLNLPPVANFNENATTVLTGEVISFNASASYDPDGNITKYFWDFGDGTNVTEFDPITTHSYADNGTYTVTLTVTDDDGATDTTTSNKTVLNRPPVADANGTYLGYEGSPITFNASDSIDNDGTIDLYEWDWDNDGSYDENTPSPLINHTWTDNFSGTVVLRVTDDDGLNDTATASVTIQNVAPTAEAGPDQTVNEGDTVSFSGSFTDPGANDTHTIFWDFGDGTNTTGTLTPTHAYGDNGVYTVTLNVTDDDCGVGTDTLTVTVNNVAPTVEAGPDQTVYVGQTVNFTGNFTDPGANDTHTIFWDFGDGTNATGTLTPTHNYTAAGVYTVTLNVTDDDGGVGLDTLNVTVLSVAVHDVAILSVTLNATKVVQGSAVNITVVAYNEGTVTESFNVTAYANTTEIGTQNVTNLGAGNQTTLSFIWDTTGFSLGNYTIKAVASTVPNETDTADNTYIDGTVKVMKHPVADANGPYPGYEGSPITFNASGSTDVDGTIVLYEWDWDNDGSYDENTPSPLINHTWTDNFSGTVGLRVTDDDGLNDTATASVTIQNVAPTAEAGPDQTVNEGDTVNFSGSFTDPGANDTHTYFWDFGDGSNASGTLTPTHAYADNGVYTVTLNVTDDDGGVGTDTLTVTVNNVVPTVNAGPDQTVNENGTVSFSGSFTDPGANDTHTYFWDFGDGSNASGTLTPTHTYADNGVYTVTLNVTDDDGGVGTDTLTVNVTNVAPTVNAGSDQTVNEGDTVSFSGSFTDPGANDTHTIFWDFGDGTNTTGTLTPTHVYGDNGVYTVTLNVTDDDGGVGTDTLTVTVTNVAPAVDAGSDQTVDEGSSVSFSGSFTDPGANDTHTYFWDFGDGTNITGTLTPTYAYGDNGVYIVTLNVTDDDGGFGVDTLTVNVTNVAPTVEAGPDQAVYVNQTVSFSGSFTDPGWLDTHTIFWDFGDGGNASGTLTPTHNYTGAGVYAVTLNVTDDDGGVGLDTLNVTVSTVAVHDVAILSVTPNVTKVVQGWAVNITVVAYNEGTVTESFNVTAYANTTVIGTQSVNLGAGAQTTLSFIWDTTGVPLGNYTISANASIVPGETDTADNTCIDGEVNVNTPPVASDLAISPVSPYTTDNLVGSYTYYDADGDPESGTEIRWYKNNVLQSAYNDQLTIPSSATAKGETWNFTVRPKDRLEFGALQTSSSVTILNSPPSIDGVNITPDPAYETSTLLATPYGWYDADGDPEGYQYQWQKWVSGSWQNIVGATTNTLTGADFNKGDQIKVICTPFDGTDSGTPKEDTVTISNSPPSAPIVDVTPDSPVTTDNLTCTVTTPSTDPDNDTITYFYEWYRDQGAGFILQPSLTTVTTELNVTIGSSNTTKGDVWRCVVTPNDGIVNGTSGQDEVTIGNSPPTADADGPYVGDEGSLITFNASGSSDPDGDTLQYRWDFENDSIWDTGYSTDPTASYTWEDDYSGIVVVEVYDGGLTDTDTATVTVNNVAPIVDAGANQTVNEGDLVYFDGNFTDPGANDTHTIHWDFGDSGSANDTLTPTHYYADNDTFTVTLTVEDDDGGVTVCTTTITVNNVAPTIEPLPNQTVNEGDPTVTGTFSDLGWNDTHTATIDWGDGTPVEPATINITNTGGPGVPKNGTVEGSHVYTDNGVYTVILNVTDDDGGVGSDTFEVTVLNVAPTVNAGPDQTVNVGQNVTFSGSFTDPGTNDTHTIFWNFGDGGNASGTLTPTHNYTAAGVYTVTLNVTDDDGGVGLDTLNVTVLEGEVHDVAVIGVWVDYGIWEGANGVYPSWNLNITVAVKNNGTVTGTFNVTLYYNETAIETKTVPDLGVGAEMNLTFNWGLSGVDYGVYTIKANATLGGDANPANDEFVDGQVKVKMPGDVDGDGYVGSSDVFTLAPAYGSVPSDPNWNPNCDFDGDGYVGSADVFILAPNYGKTYQDC